MRGFWAGLQHRRLGLAAVALLGLAWPAAAQGPAAVPATIAVLPLENNSGDAKQDFFAGGMTDEIAAALAGVRGLDVVARSSAFRLPPALRHWCARLVALSTLVFALVILWGSYQMALSTHDNRIPTLGISEAWRYAPLMIAGVLISLFSIDRLLRREAPHE